MSHRNLHINIFAPLCMKNAVIITRLWIRPAGGTMHVHQHQLQPFVTKCFESQHIIIQKNSLDYQFLSNKVNVRSEKSLNLATKLLNQQLWLDYLLFLPSEEAICCYSFMHGEKTRCHRLHPSQVIHHSNPINFIALSMFFKGIFVSQDGSQVQGSFSQVC